LQALLAPLQALWPLQALVPPHFTSAKEGEAKVLAAKIAAAVVIRVRLFMGNLLGMRAFGPHQVSSRDSAPTLRRII
jgi:hypothetical protein